MTTFMVNTPIHKTHTHTRLTDKQPQKQCIHVNSDDDLVQCSGCYRILYLAESLKGELAK